jgi:hypothetical protein
VGNPLVICPNHRIFALQITTMRIASFCFLFLLSQSVWSQDCHRAYWVDGYDGSQAFEHFIDIDRHPDGGFVVCGKHSADGTTLGNQSVNTGAFGYYLARMDSAGNFSQLTSLFSQDGIALKRITVLPDGSIAAGCTVNANITLGSETFHIHGGAKPLLIKFDSQFNYQWHRASENTSNSSEMRDISCDSEGNIYWGGLFSGNYLSFGGDFYLQRTTDGGAWLSKVNAQGQFQWIRGIAPGVSAGLQTVTVDSNDDVWISGQASLGANAVLKFSDQIIAPGYLTNAWCTYVAKFDANGTCIWGKVSSNTSTFGSIYTADAMADDEGNMYLCGQLTGTFEWSGMPMIGGDGSGFLWSLDTNGNGRWFKTMGGQGSSESASALDVRGNRIAVVGYLSSNQPYVGKFPVYSLGTGTYKTFNAQFFNDGELEFCRMNQNDTQNFMQHDVVIDEGLNQIVFGYYKGTNVAWYPFTLTHTGTNPKMFVAKYGPSSPTVFTISAGPDKVTTCSTNVQLNGSTTPSSGVGFGWWPDMGFSGNYSKTPNANTGAPTDYIFYGYYQGCVKRDTVHVDLTNYNLSLTAIENTAHCFGDTSQLAAVCSDPNATIAWTPNYRLTSAVAFNTNSFTNTSLNYVAEATINGCKARDTVYVHVNRKPTIDLPYQQFYQTYQMHTCIDLPIFADLGLPENDYTITPETNITWQNDHSVVFSTDQLYYGGTIAATSPEGCENEIIFTVYAYDYQPAPPIYSQPNDTVYLCPAAGYVYEEEFLVTTDILYNPNDFNFSWYSGWQVDSLDGLGWRDIEYWNHGHYELFPNSVGYPNSAYYVPLRFWNVEPGMDGFKYRAYIHDICSPRVYTNQMVLRVGPAFTDQSTALTICEGATDTLFVASANSNGLYQWQVFRNNAWIDLLANEDNIQINDDQLILSNVFAGMDTLFRCRIDGCSPNFYSYSDPIVVSVQSNNLTIAGPFQTTGCLGETIALYVETNGGSFDAQWMRDGAAINNSVLGHTGFNNDTLFIQTNLFNPQNHVYRCELYNAQCGQNFTTSDLTVEINIPSAINWPLAQNELCADDEALLIATASPMGGIYSGSGLSGDYINPSLNLPGDYDIQYMYVDSTTGCSSTSIQTVTIWALPLVTVELSANSACIQNAAIPIEVTTAPIGGTIDADGLAFESATHSFPLPESSGIFTITYTYTDLHGCESSALTSFEALDTMAIQWTTDLGTFCGGSTEEIIALPLPTGGQFNPYTVTDNVIQTEALSSGDHTLSYQYTAANGCVSQQLAQFYIQDLVVVWTDSLLSACYTSEPIVMGNPSPEGGIYSGIGIVGELFSPGIAGVGFHPVTYTYLDSQTGCTASATQYIQVYDQPLVTFVMSDHDLCIDEDVLTLMEGQPSGGIYSGAGVFEPSPGAFFLMPSNLSEGSYDVTYSYIDGSGCSSSVTETYVIYGLPVLTWVDHLGDFCTNTPIAEVTEPNPNGGSFSPTNVSNGLLDLSTLTPGQYEAQYLYVDEFGCAASILTTYTLQDTTTITWTPLFPEYPNNGFYFCGNFELNAQADLTAWAQPAAGDFYLEGSLLDNQVWTWGDPFEFGFYDITYTYTDPNSGCVSQSIQPFLLDLCGAVAEDTGLAPRCWSDGRNQLWLTSPSAGRFEMVNASGQLVHQGILRSGLQQESIPLAAGVYFVRMAIGDDWSFQKLLIGYE